jgi:hypothetical protein
MRKDFYVRLDTYIFDHRPARRHLGLYRDSWRGGGDRADTVFYLFGFVFGVLGPPPVREMTLVTRRAHKPGRPF